MWRFLGEQGLKTWQTTMLPRTTSADGWATDADQILDPDRSAKIHELNQWLRDLAPMSTAFVGAVTGASGGGVIRAGDAGPDQRESSMSASWPRRPSVPESGRQPGRQPGDRPMTVCTPTAMSAALVPAIDTSVFVL